jgi:hypothetical protein
MYTLGLGEADDMIDTHLINVALAGFGWSIGAAVLIAVAIIAVVGIMQHRAARTSKAAEIGRRQAVSAPRREPALR